MGRCVSPAFGLMKILLSIRCFAKRFSSSIGNRPVEGFDIHTDNVYMIAMEVSAQCIVGSM